MKWAESIGTSFAAAVDVAVAARQAAIIYTHPKISYTSFPVLPSDDSKYRYPNQLNPSPLQPSPIGPVVNGVVVIP